ncbi:MAG TPA: hypothetical protein VKR21_13490 [Solirubrobacteraceae bacterium]|nr:hypothetical protein [Solirubrobacteraceae bacterium]
MADLGLADQSDVRTLVMEARDRLAAGDHKRAARLLSDAAHSTHDPELEAEVRELAEQGRERAGRFRKGRWSEIIRVTDLRSRRPGIVEATTGGMSDLVMTRQFVEQVKPEALRAELLRHIDEGVRAIHISLTLPLREPVRCIARTEASQLGPRS